jgi:hypothetical protein
MAKAGRTLQELAAEITRRAEAKRDFIAPVSNIAMIVEGSRPLIDLRMTGGTESFPLTNHAHGQLAEYAGVPMPYYRRMEAEQPDLLAANVNTWLRTMGADKRRMVRTLDGSMRAFLGDGYRQLENEDLAEAILPVLMELDLMILSCEITDRRLYIKAVDRSIERDVPTGKHMGDGGHTIFDTCCPALTVSNSEIGGGALAVSTGVWTKACTNLADFGANMRKYHTGKRAELSDEVYALLTDETKKATDKAVWMQTTDLVKGAFAVAQFEALCKRLGTAAADPIPAAAVVETVEVVGKRFSLTGDERKGVLAALIRDGDLSRYGLHSAVTRYSQDDAVSYDRATELERIGGEIIDMEDIAI